jgi:hypothetical protein
MTPITQALTGLFDLHRVVPWYEAKQALRHEFAVDRQEEYLRKIQHPVLVTFPRCGWLMIICHQPTSHDNLSAEAICNN